MTTSHTPKNWDVPKTASCQVGWNSGPPALHWQGGEEKKEEVEKRGLHPEHSSSILHLSEPPLHSFLFQMRHFIHNFQLVDFPLKGSQVQGKMKVSFV